jgi:hypothetical protein
MSYKEVFKERFSHLQKNTNYHNVPLLKLGDKISVGGSNPYSKYMEDKPYNINENGGFVIDDSIYPSYFTNLTQIRETVFENVRLKYFPHLPSRLSCLWICKEHDVRNLLHWSNELKKGKGSIMIDTLMLELSGKIFECDSSFLDWKINRSLGSIYENAEKYWSGNRNGGTTEILFEGEGVVVDNHPFKVIQ